MTAMLSQASSLEYLWSTYFFLCSVIILLMIANIVRSSAFQPRLSVLAGSLYLLTSDLLHLFTIFIIIAVILSVLFVIIVGPSLKNASTFNNAFISVCTLFVTGASGDYNLTMLRNLNLSTVMFFAAIASFIFLIVLVLFILRNFVVVIVMWPYSTLIFCGRYSSTIGEDLVTLFKWKIAELRRKSWTNNTLLSLSVKTLQQKRSLRAMVASSFKTLASLAPIRAIESVMERSSQRSSRVQPVNMDEIDLEQKGQSSPIHPSINLLTTRSGFSQKIRANLLLRLGVASDGGKLEKSASTPHPLSSSALSHGSSSRLISRATSSGTPQDMIARLEAWTAETHVMVTGLASQLANILVWLELCRAMTEHVSISRATAGGVPVRPSIEAASLIDDNTDEVKFEDSKGKIVYAFVKELRESSPPSELASLGNIGSGRWKGIEQNIGTGRWKGIEDNMAEGLEALDEKTHEEKRTAEHLTS